MLIDRTYFNELITVPNANEPEPNSRTSEDLRMAIEMYERQLLSMAFGPEMYAEIKGLNLNGEIPEHYKRLIYGHTYTRNGRGYRWEGLTPDIQPKGSLIADFVYHQYTMNILTTTTEFGEVAIDVKVGNRTSATPKLTRIWNRFVSRFSGTAYAGDVAGYTPEGNPFWFVNGGVIYYGYNSSGGEVSLLHFLRDFKADFPLLRESAGHLFQLKNSFGV